jgi:hypothetical protein
MADPVAVYGAVIAPAAIGAPRPAVKYHVLAVRDDVEP